MIAILSRGRSVNKMFQEHQEPSNNSEDQILAKLEQLERLHSENTPSRPMITHTIDSYQIPCHSKTKSKLQILN